MPREQFPFAKIATLLSHLENIKCHDPPFLPGDESIKLKTTTETWFRSNSRLIHELDVKSTTALLSTLLPERRVDRVYSVQRNRLQKILGRALSLRNSSLSDLGAHAQPGHGDLADCLERVMKAHGPPAHPPVTVGDVDEILEKLAGRRSLSAPNVQRLPSSGDSSLDVQGVLLRATPVEGKWIARFLMNNLSPVRLDDDLVLRSYHFLLPDLLRFQNSFGAAIGLLKTQLKDYPIRPDSRSERLLRQSAGELIKPVVGIKVGSPELQKARSIVNCMDMVDKKTWVLERKYDGEYCEIHINVCESAKPESWITIFSKVGKDSTKDREGLHATLVECLRLTRPVPERKIKRQAILLGELVVCSGDSNLPLPFEEIRKHVIRSGRFLGTDEDSQAKEDEHLAIVFFDILLLDDDILMRLSIDERRRYLREIYQKKRGRAMSAEWRIVDFAAPEARKQLMTQFAASTAQRYEGLILKPCSVPYVTLGPQARSYANSYIKLKKDYFAGMGNEADFAIVGASYDAQRAAESGLRNLKWTDFHLGCLTNKKEVQRFEGTRPRYKIVDTISHKTCIPKPVLQALNAVGQYCSKDYDPTHQPAAFDLETKANLDISVTFKTPMVVEVLSSESEKPSNCRFLTLRHAKMNKLHEDRSWKETISFQDLQEEARKTRAALESSESQETQKQLAKMERQCARKFERYQHAKTTLSSRKTATPSTASSPAASRRSRRLHDAVAAGDDIPEVSLQGSSPTVSTDFVTLPSTKRSSEERKESPCPPSKRCRTVRNPPLKKDTHSNLCKPADCQHKSSPLTDITDIFNARRQQPVAHPAPSRPTNPTSSASTTASERYRQHQSSSPIDELGPRRFYTPASDLPPALPSTTACKTSACLFSNTALYLAPCIASTPYIFETLLSHHHVILVPKLSCWDRDSFSHAPFTATVSESQSYSEMRKVVLVERKREEAVKAVVDIILASNDGKFRESVEVWDWRVLEQGLCAKHHLGREGAMRHFLGSLIFDSGKGRPVYVEAF